MIYKPSKIGIKGVKIKNGVVSVWYDLLDANMMPIPILSHNPDNPNDGLRLESRDLLTGPVKEAYNALIEAIDQEVLLEEPKSQEAPLFDDKEEDDFGEYGPEKET